MWRTRITKESLGTQRTCGSASMQVKTHVGAKLSMSEKCGTAAGPRARCPAMESVNTSASNSPSGMSALPINNHPESFYRHPASS